MTTIVFCGDPHLSDRPPVGRAPDYRAQIIAKLAEVGRVAAAVGVTGADAVVLLGDLFHVSRANLVSHSLVREIAAILRDYPCPIYAVMGNHDMGEEGLASLHRQPLGVLAEAGVLQVPTEPVQLMAVSLIFRHYDARLDTSPAYYMPTEAESDSGGRHILVAHGSLVPPGQQERFPTLEADEIDGYAAIISGHIHEPFGVRKMRNGVWFANPGSLGRVARMPYNERIPSVLVMGYGGTEFSWREWELETALPPGEIFLAPEAADEEATDEIRAFAVALSQGMAAETFDIETLLASVTGVSDSVKAHVRRLLVQGGL